MDGIHPPFKDEDLEVTLKSNDSDSDADTVISALERTIKDLDTTFDTGKNSDSKTQKQNQPWQQKQPLPG